MYENEKQKKNRNIQKIIAFTKFFAKKNEQKS